LSGVSFYEGLGCVACQGLDSVELGRGAPCGSAAGGSMSFGESVDCAAAVGLSDCKVERHRAGRAKGHFFALATVELFCQKVFFVIREKESIKK
jgi:hypothetical protein